MTQFVKTVTAAATLMVGTVLLGFVTHELGAMSGHRTLAMVGSMVVWIVVTGLVARWLLRQPPGEER